ncbi:carbamoyl-phosphate synthase large subunit [Kiritimatiellaeota bacterium B1221]|nr:carbamoyl-phosphate synthase large subunit [Kiritimatiellaeota bacterium B1221]
MPKREDIHKIMLIGSGPIIIGQACEFDYSGTQACKALREEGYEIVLINSNPATIMTDPEIADRTYIEPITPEAVEKIIAKERPDALLPTLGGQTALNTALEVANLGILEKYGVEMIGANAEVIHKAEDRDAFKECMKEAQVETLISIQVHTVEDALKAADEIGYPVIVRPSFTMGGTGGGTADNKAELKEIAASGLKHSLNTTILVEESVYGWKEYEMEVMRDHKDNVVIICSIENLDHMGIHTGDSITVAPSQTLTDVEFQEMRDATIRVMRAIGVETGGSNVQFSINPKDGRMIVIEMNPRVSRSSALASKATGFPIAKIAAKLAVGYSLDELPNDITRETPASFEPTLDYCVVKIPRFAFEKFQTSKPSLGVSMKSVGETMAIGRNMKEAFQKALRGLERGFDGYDLKCEELVKDEVLEGKFAINNPDRIFRMKTEIKNGMSIEELYQRTHIDPWFLDMLVQICEREKEILDAPELTAELMKDAKDDGFSDAQIAALRGLSELEVRKIRKDFDIIPKYRVVDTCAGEFEAYTPYYYSSYGISDEYRKSDKPKIMILGSGPNRIGQGIEFDYCCVHTVMALRELGYETIMVNSNPETVSTDYDTSDKLYFEPLTFEDVMNIYEREKPEGVVVQMGGQTPLNLSVPLAAAGVPVLGTPADSIDQAEDRERCRVLLNELGLKQPESATSMNVDDALETAQKIGLPVMIRPSYVLGGRAMMVARSEDEIIPFVKEAIKAAPHHPVLIDRFLENAVEADVDVLCDTEDVYVGGVMEHVEAAGIHSGDSACCTPPYSLSPLLVDRIKDACGRIALRLKVRGMLNVQVAVHEGEIYIIEINPRASRTVPYLSKSTGIPMAKLAAQVSVGRKIKELNLPVFGTPNYHWYAVKEAVFPFNRFAGVDPILSPEMKSTGEVMGMDYVFEAAFWKAQIAAGQALPKEGTVFLSANDESKAWMTDIAVTLHGLGFKIIATEGTAKALAEKEVPAETLYKLAEEKSPNIRDYMADGKVNLIINTPSSAISKQDEITIRAEAVTRGIPIITTKWGALPSIAAIEYINKRDWTVTALQEYFLASPSGNKFR